MTTFGEGFIKVRPETSGFAAEADSKIGGALKNVAKIAAGALAIGGAADFLKDSIKNAVKFQEQMAGLDQTLKNVGQGTDEAKTKASNYVEALSKMSGFARVDVATSLQRATQGTKNLGQAMQVETTAANLARARHIDLNQATLLVTKAFAGNTSSLKRMGISFTPVTAATDALKTKIATLTKEQDGASKSQKELIGQQIKNVKAQLDTAKASDKANTTIKVQKTLIDLTKGGMKTFGETTAGKLALASNAIDDLETRIGTALLPVIGKLASFAAEEIDKLNEHWPEIQKQVDEVTASIKADFDKLKPVFNFLGGLIQGIVTKLGGIGQTIKILGVAIAAFVVITKTLEVTAAIYRTLSAAIFLATHAQEALDVAMETNPIGLVVIAIAALAAGLYLAYTRSATFRQIVNSTFAALKVAAQTSIQFITQRIIPGLIIEFDAVKRVVLALLPIFRTIFNGVATVVKNEIDIVVNVFKTFNDLIHGRWSAAWDDVKKIPAEVFAIIKAVVQTQLSVLAQTAGVLALAVAHRIANAIKQAPSFLEGLAGSLASKVKDAISQAAKGVFNEAKKIGSYLAQGIVSGVGDLATALKNKVTGALGSALGGIRSFAHINSPSLLFAKEVGEPITEGIVYGTQSLGKDLAQSLKNNLADAISNAKQNLTSIAGTLGSDIGQIIDANLANTDIGGTTVGAASAKIAQDQADRQQRQLQSSLDAAKAAAAAGPGLTDAAGKPLTPDAVASAQADLNQAVEDAQTDLDDFLLQAKIKAATDQAAIAKQSVTDQIALWTYQFNQGLLSQQDYINDINGLAGAYGDAGTTLGTAFAINFNAQLAGLVQQVQALATSGLGGDSGLGPNIVNPSDAVVAQLVTATGNVGTDKGAVADATRALAAAQNADARARVANFNDGHQTAATKKAQAAADKALEAAQQQLKTAQASETKDNLIVATLRQILIGAGQNPDDLLAAAAR